MCGPEKGRWVEFDVMRRKSYFNQIETRRNQVKRVFRPVSFRFSRRTAISTQSSLRSGISSHRTPSPSICCMRPSPGRISPSPPVFASPAADYPLRSSIESNHRIGLQEVRVPPGFPPCSFLVPLG